MNHLTLGCLAGGATPPSSDQLPRSFGTVAVPRRRTSSTDRVGVTVLGAQPVAAVHPLDGAVVAIEAYVRTTRSAVAVQTDVVASHIHPLGPAAPSHNRLQATPPVKENTP